VLDIPRLFLCAALTRALRPESKKGNYRSAVASNPADAPLGIPIRPFRLPKARKRDCWRNRKSAADAQLEHLKHWPETRRTKAMLN
jgi:hypothetical protein